MLSDQSINVLLGGATIYLALITIVFTLTPSLKRGISFLAYPMRYLRIFTIALAIKLAVELYSLYGSHIFCIKGNDLIFRIDIPLWEGIEILFGTILIFLLLNACKQFYRIEQIARKVNSYFSTLD